jgi:hypothetical protein
MFVPRALFSVTYIVIYFVYAYTPFLMHTHTHSLTHTHIQAFDASKFNDGAVIINKGGEGADR